MKLAITNFFMPNGACTVHCTTQLLPYNKLTKSKRPRSIKLAILFSTGFSLKALGQSQTLFKKSPEVGSFHEKKFGALLKDI